MQQPPGPGAGGGGRGRKAAAGRREQAVCVRELRRNNSPYSCCTGTNSKFPHYLWYYYSPSSHACRAPFAWSDGGGDGDVVLGGQAEAAAEANTRGEEGRKVLEEEVEEQCGRTKVNSFLLHG